MQLLVLYKVQVCPNKCKICMFGYASMAMHVWLCMFGYICMAMYVWLCMYGYVCLAGYACMAMYVCTVCIS